MDPTEPRYFLRSGGKRARADDSDADGEWLADDPEVIHDDAGSREDNELSVSPETPTPAPRANASGAERPTSRLGNNTTRAPATVPSSRPLRRLLFPEAATPGRRARQFLPARPSLRGNPIPAVANRPSSSVAYHPAGHSSVTLGGYAVGGGGLSSYQQASNFARTYPLGFSVPSATTAAPVNPSPFAVGNRWDGQHNFGTRGDGGLSWLDPQLLPSVPWVPSPVTSWPGVAGAANNLNPPQGQGRFGGQSFLSDLGYLAPYGHASSPVLLRPNSFGGAGGIGLRVNPGAPLSGYLDAPSGGLEILDDALVPVASDRPFVPPANDYAAFLRGLSAGPGDGDGQGARANLGSRGARGAAPLSGSTWLQQGQLPPYHPGRPQGFVVPSSNFVGNFSSFPATNPAGLSSTSLAGTRPFSATSVQPPLSPSFSFRAGTQTAMESFPTTAPFPGNPAASAPNRAVSRRSLISASRLEDPFVGNRSSQSAARRSAGNQARFRNPNTVPSNFMSSTDHIMAQPLYNVQPLPSIQPLSSNANQVEYETMQREVGNRAQAGNLIPQTTQPESLNGSLAENAQVNQNLVVAGNQVDFENLSTVGHKDPDSDATEFAPNASQQAVDSSAQSGNEESDKENSDSEDEESSDEDEDEDEDDDHSPAPHIPDVLPEHMYNTGINPAAAYWVDLPPAPFFTDGYNILPKPEPKPLNMYAGLPAFDTDPFLPFAPWRVNQLPPFRPEPINRMLTVPLRFLSAVGSLYPDSTFLVSRHPASANFTTRIKGAALAQSVALHFPAFTNDPPATPIKREENDHNQETDDMYILALIQRDWPLGGVALLPNTDSARAFITDMRESFDILPDDQEAFYFVPCDLAGTSTTPTAEQPNSNIYPTPNTESNAINTTNPRPPPKGMYILRAYEGRKGPQHPRLITAWVQEHGGGRGGDSAAGSVTSVEQDVAGRAVLVRMGEAWVEPEKWGRARVGKRARKAAAAPREKMARGKKGGKGGKGKGGEEGGEEKGREEGGEEKEGEKRDGGEMEE